jgi:hypothetical protein
MEQVIANLTFMLKELCESTTFRYSTTEDRNQPANEQK